MIRLSLEDDRTIDNINIKFEADTEDEKSFCNSSLCNEFITEKNSWKCIIFNELTKNTK